MQVGVLALQGDFREHADVLRRIGVDVIEVRKAEQLAQVDRLILPGGESTAIGKLLVRFDLLAPIQARGGRDLAIWGTCAGAILLAKTVLDQKTGGQPTLGLMDITVRRNAFGSQLDSFETQLAMPVIGAKPLPAVFIRAPQIVATAPAVEILAQLENGQPVVVRQGRLMATTFHPELTDDDRVHRLFLTL
jgi:pyridoxal 5'-phosphate synthase pdxT subunit